MKKVYLLLSLFIFITSCEKDDLKQEQPSENEVKTTEAPTLGKKIDRQEIESNPKIIQEISKIGTNTTEKSREKYIHINNPNLIMIVDKATYIKKGKYDSYTFPTVQSKDEKIKNILFNKNEQGSYDTYLMEYNYSWNEFTDVDLDELPKEFRMSPLNLNLDALNQKQMVSMWVCVYESSWFTPDQGQLDAGHLAGWVQSPPVCTIVYYDVVGRDYSPTYTSTYTTNGETATYTGTSTIATSPTFDPLLDEEFLHALNVVKSELGTRLHDREKRYLDSQLAVTMNNYWFLKKHGFSEEAKNFSAEAVSAAFSRGEVDYDHGVIIDRTLKNTCAEKIILDFITEDFSTSIPNTGIEITSLINKVFDKLASSNPDFTLTFKSASINGHGNTSSSAQSCNNGKCHFTITLDDDLINNGTKLAIAKTILHEGIHAYLQYIQKQNPQTMNSPSEGFSDLINAWNIHNNLGYAHHVYMASIIEDMGTQLSNYATNYMSYPIYDVSYGTFSKSYFYQAVAWSGIAVITDPQNINSTIINPIFQQVFSSTQQQNEIINIFNSENFGTQINGQNPIIKNNCN